MTQTMTAPTMTAPMPKTKSKARKVMKPAMIFVVFTMAFLAIPFIRLFVTGEDEFGTYCSIPALLSFFFWLPYAIMGRKNHYKKAIARLLRHMMFSLLAIVMVYDSGFFAQLFWAGFTYGASFLILIKTDAIGEMSEEDWAQWHADKQYQADYGKDDGLFGCVGFVFLVALCGLIGIIAMPIVVTKDVIAIYRLRAYA